MCHAEEEIGAALRDRAVRLMREHRSGCRSLMVASAAVARQVGVGHESVRRWVLQAGIDDGTRDGVPAPSTPRSNGSSRRTSASEKTSRS